MGNFHKIIVITGPTATGKTALGIFLTKKFNGEIISADSRQVYKGNDVESGKDKSFFQWGIDIAEPGVDFNVAAFVIYANKIIKNILNRGKLPIVVGGSGQYIKELLNPSETLFVPQDQKLRAKLAGYSVTELQRLVNPPAGGEMNPSDWQNPRRLIRAIEIAKVNKKFEIKNEKYDALVIGLTASKEIIYQKIVTRRRDRPDLVEKEFKLAKKQLLYMQKYLQPLWFDITDSKTDNRIECLIQEFVRPPTNKERSTPII